MDIGATFFSAGKIRTKFPEFSIQNSHYFQFSDWRATDKTADGGDRNFFGTTFVLSVLVGNGSKAISPGATDEETTTFTKLDKLKFQNYGQNYRYRPWHHQFMCCRTWGKKTLWLSLTAKDVTPLLQVVAFTDGGERKVGEPAKRQAITNPKQHRLLNQALHGRKLQRGAKRNHPRAL